MKRTDLEHILRACKVKALIRHKMIRAVLLEELIASTPDGGLRERVAESWAICRRRAVDEDVRN